MGIHTLPVVLPPETKKPQPRKIELGAAPANDAFLDAILHSQLEEKRRSPLDWLVSAIVHTLLLVTLLLIPLYFTQKLNLIELQGAWLVAPPPPPPPPPPAAPRAATSQPPSFVHHGELVAPTAIPKKVTIVKESAPPPELGGGVPGGVVGGVPGGQIGGALGGILGSVKTPTAVPPPPAERVQRSKILRVGGNVKPPRLIYSVEPVYPPVAKMARITGTVVIEAVIDEQGNVVRAQVLSGNPMLVQAALDAVAKWKYEPTLLNGQPIAVEMKVFVDFVLRD